MTESFIDYTLSRIAEQNPLHFKKVRKNLRKMGQEQGFEKQAKEFYDKYDSFLSELGKNREYAVDSYLRMITDVMVETVAFENTGEYTSKSFEEVNQRVYANPLIMDYYMHGLLMSQFLWTHHFAVLQYYITNLPKYKSEVRNYLEVGGGHGLYVNEATRCFGSSADINVIDISETSLAMARYFVESKKVNFIHSDVFKYFPERKYDFITMGEVLEHVEEPVALLKKLHELLSESGTVFITTPTNAPAIDHLYLFRNAADIHRVIDEAGFRVESELKVYAEDVPEELAEQLKITLMYAAFLKKK
ncbi:MAG TPA: class I SAM-dependent methyltransferase [Bacteroidia bacterium]|nr:class I SAM-dependent methyltransferase [Bacteroidia bacterium]